ncbi:spastic paraplegia 7 [Mytilus galloprovincialis]|uniref:Spastic paraplegia 7 n=1 Tax=Mytilus galloprovincialis TaxID=29158 RepID=A0A8B6HIH4_MYTGA|nr:spastic paraplegia 7 [Mytilus galloprovincialis]
MSLWQFYRSGRRHFSICNSLNKLHNNRTAINSLLRQYSVLKQNNSRVSFKKFQTNQNRTFHQLSRDFRFLSSLLTKCGFHREATLAKEVAGHVRCFSTTGARLDKTDSDKDKQENDADKEKHNDEDDDKEKENERKEAMEHMWRMLIRVSAISLILFIMMNMTMPPDPAETASPYSKIYITWQEFYHDLLLKGEVDRIQVLPNGKYVHVYPHHGAMFKGEPAFQRYVLTLPDSNYKFEEKIREAEKKLGIAPENGVSIHYEKINALEQNMMNLLILAVVAILAFSILAGTSKTASSNSSKSMFDSVRKAKFTRVDPKDAADRKISFNDVAGLHEAKVEVMEFMDYLKDPKRYKALGAKLPKGALLLGPPGCGKTLLAKALASEAGVPFLAMAGSEFVEMIGGLGASRVRDLFQEARKSAPCCIYIDEIDAIGRKRGGSSEGGNSEEENTLNQLLVEMDGMGTVEGVIMLASTNRSDVLDNALLRPGRFDRQILIDFPTLIERKEMFDIYLKNLKLSESSEESLAYKLAQLTPRMTGADIANICNEAALHAAREKQKSIEVADFDYAVERVISGVSKKSSVLSPAEKKITAYHESGHALVGWMLESTDAVLKISIIPRTSNVLGFARYSPQDRKLISKEMLFEQICVGLGGRVAESLIFNKVTTGAEDDLKKISKIAYLQIKSFGMNERVGLLSFPDEDGGFGTKPYSKKLAAIIDEEAQVLIAKAYKCTEKILIENKDKLHLMAEELLKNEVITYDNIKDLIGPPPHGEKNKIELVNPLAVSFEIDNNKPMEDSAEK